MAVFGQVFLFCVFVDRDGVEVHKLSKKKKKKEQGQYPAKPVQAILMLQKT